MLGRIEFFSEPLFATTRNDKNSFLFPLSGLPYISYAI